MHQEYTIERRVTFAETDMAGIAHFSNYFRFMEEVEHEFFRSLGLSIMLKDGDRHVTWPRVATDCNFTAPIRFEDLVKISMHIARVGRSSLTFSFRFDKDSQTVASGSIKTACCQLVDGDLKAIPIPERILEQVRPFVDEQTAP